MSPSKRKHPRKSLLPTNLLQCNCAAAKYARVEQCVHAACAAKLLAPDPAADANPAPPKYDDRGADLQGGF